MEQKRARGFFIWWNSIFIQELTLDTKNGVVTSVFRQSPDIPAELKDVTKEAKEYIEAECGTDNRCTTLNENDNTTNVDSTISVKKNKNRTIKKRN